jgi:acetamidase/formamidase
MGRVIVDSTPLTATDVFTTRKKPICTVRSGDELLVSTLDASGSLRRHSFPGEKVETLLPDRRGHCLVGPIEVIGAEVGTVLAVSFLALTPSSWGWTAAGVLDNELNRRLQVLKEGPRWLLWSIDTGTQLATNQFRISRKIAPFLGVVGMPPDSEEEYSTIPPRTKGAGNIDCKELVAGSTLYIPVTVPGAMLCLGDGHAAQGDGEVSGTAIECAMTSHIKIEVLKEAPIDAVHAVTPKGRLTFGFDPDLNVAMADALYHMVTWMQEIYSLSRAEALALGSSCVDLRITQVANVSFGVHALLDESQLLLRWMR